MELPFRVAVGQFKELTHEDLRFCRQIGVAGITVNRPDFDDASWRNLLGKHHPYGPANFGNPHQWDFMDLVNLRRLVEEHGLRLEAIENLPFRFIDRILAGADGRDAQIGHYCETIRNLGRAGIRILGYHWAPNLVWRTSVAEAARGGATTTAFDLADAAAAPPTHGRAIDAAEQWRNFEYFISRVLPVAEEAGVRLALHPDDPPVPSLGGVARIMSSPEGLARALSVGDSPNHALTFCVGTCAAMGVDAMYGALERFAQAGRIAYVHLRSVRGAVPRFSECFIDEGDVDVVRVLRILRDAAFEGFVIDDHVPKMTADTPWGHRGRAFATGYIRGVCRALASAGA